MFRNRCFYFLFIATISVLFLTGCPGASDFDVDLPGEYSIVRLSAHEVKIAPKTSANGWGKAIIPTKVIEAGWNNQYIIAKQVELMKDPKRNNGMEIPDEKNYHYWILEIKNGKVTGPLDDADFTKKKQEYQIFDDVVLKSVGDLERNYTY
ncbi:DUF3997 domain-containing protein [Bacillus massiliigorillae]|uniref:DUF3997 domain-containing protein n=1 Tax=Bacillus massiliigorillae TaxID=1243664 RepID=UPI0003AADF4E|nr:DUF3997 domain-containing protein [Bacillus massiliigorillae]